MRPHFALAACLLLLAVTSAFASESVRVVGVVDGDTIRVLRHGKQEIVRLHGIDAPERGQAFGRASARALGALLRGRSADIEPTSTDRYGRTVALVHAGGDVINREIVRKGMAWVWPRYCTQEYCRDWSLDQDEARAARRGLWRGKSPVPPWEWRAVRRR